MPQYAAHAGPTSMRSRRRPPDMEGRTSIHAIRTLGLPTTNQEYTRPRATAASASVRRSATVFTGLDLQDPAQRGQQRAQRVALGHRRERDSCAAASTRCAGIVDEHARSRHVQIAATRVA